MKKKPPIYFKIINADYFWIIFSILALFYFVSLTIRDFNTYNSALYIEKSIEVLAPNISNKEVLELRTQFRLVN